MPLQTALSSVRRFQRAYLWMAFRATVGLFEEKYNRQAVLTEVADAEGDPLGSNEKLKRGLGWQPRFGIHGIANAIG